MKKYILVISVFTFVLSSTLYGQQNKMLTHFIFDKMTVNPGSTGVGMKEGFCGTSIYRNQWDRVAGAPNSALLNIEGNFERYLPGGIGLSFFHDAIGVARQNNLLLNYSYHFDLPSGTLGAGIGLGIMSFGMNNAEWVTPDNNPNDQSLPQAMTEIALDANFGVYYSDKQGWYAGLSMMNLPTSEYEMLNFQNQRHYYIMGGYRLASPFGGDLAPLDLDFNMMTRTDMVKTSLDLNVRAIWQDLFWAGFSYRTVDALGIMAGMQITQEFLIGYSYDINMFNKFSNISRGSHELLVRYCYLLPPPPVTKSRNPRYL